ncbi:DUF3786 domain-containing protein [Thermodesulfobacteriota bacterium]
MGEEGICFKFNFLNRRILIEWPGLSIYYEDSNEEMPIQQQILILHYLLGAWNSSGAPVTGEWIAFQDIPDGKFYMDAFQRRAKIPLVQSFGNRPELLVSLAKKSLGADSLDQGDHAVMVKALPLVPIALIIWAGDDEFPPEGNVLFDRNVTRLLSAEDIVWLAGMVVYPLMGMAGR